MYLTTDRSPSLPRAAITKKKGAAPVLSTTGLIFENRPRYGSQMNAQK